MYALIYDSEVGSDFKVVQLSQLSELLRNGSESFFRSAYFYDTDDKNVITKSSAETPLYGPLTISLMVRRAKDLLLDPCYIPDFKIEVEAAGQKLPQLPARAELIKLLKSDDTYVIVNDKAYKPSSEVLDFSQVYEDSVKTIEALKRLKIPSNKMAIFATPEEISIEVHPGIIGIEGRANLNELYFNLLASITGIKQKDGKLQKTSVKTVTTDMFSPGGRILLPGSNHPRLKRPRVGVGASHFAYGVAAFSDYCSKQRSAQESVDECIKWLSFLNTETTTDPDITDKVLKMPSVYASASKTSAPKSSQPSSKVSLEDFASLKSILASQPKELAFSGDSVKTFSPGLNKALNGGWTCGKVHLIVGPRESGKLNIIIQQAMLTQKECQVLIISYENSIREFSLRCLSKITATDRATLTSTQSLQPLLNKLESFVTDNLFFSGAEIARNEIDTTEIEQLVKMLPDNQKRLVVLDSVFESVFKDNPDETMYKLKQLAQKLGITLIINFHFNIAAAKRPHFIEGQDVDLMSSFQRFVDTIITINTEKTNLRKFVAMIKGQIDAALVGKLEQKALQMAKGRRLKTDTYSLFRIIHNNNGNRELFLYLYQPDSNVFHELASLQLNRG